MHISCGGLSISLDSPRGDVSFLSHAHSDHASGMKKQRKVICSEATFDLAGLCSEIVSVPGARMVDAGHIFGSRQLVAEEDGKKTVYTGDISLHRNIFGNSAAIEQCDRLIIEATYGGSPEYDFPELSEVYAEISSWVKANESSNLIIGAYEMGKAQELVKVLNEYCALAPIVTRKTERFCSIFERHGVKLDRVPVGSDEAEEAMSRRFVAIVPMRHAKRYFAHRLSDAFGRKTLCAVATGWALAYRFDADAAFPLSDHADFNGLLTYIRGSGAREIEFFAGDGGRLLSALKNGAILNL